MKHFILHWFYELAVQAGIPAEAYDNRMPLKLSFTDNRVRKFVSLFLMVLTNINAPVW